MFNINEELKTNIYNLNDILTQKYNSLITGDRKETREFITENVGSIMKIEKLSTEELSIWNKNGGIVAVDGSTNRLGGAYPHYLDLFQSLAKSTKYKDMPLYKTDIYTPLLNEEESILEDDIIMDKKDMKLATIEVEVAIESLDRLKPYAILMDGGFIRYHIYCKDKWEELRRLCEENNIILAGVIKDIKTSIIGDVMKSQDSSLHKIYDRESLFGILDYGEIISIRETVNKKHLEQGIASAFIRSSLSPKVIGMDIIDSQKKHLEQVTRLILTLTPENSRGVPLWLDIVDTEVKISDQMTRALLQRYMDRGIYERFFVSERDKRN